jgi:uncharacterized protein YidB (DUF937 family)
MGLLDSLESMAITSLQGNSSNSLAASLLQMIQNQPRGLQGLVQSFHDKGLGGVVSSWVSTGQNLPISADQIQQVLGSGKLQQLAAQAGLSPDAAGSSIAQLLPTIVDKLTPNGQVPDHSNAMEMISGLLSSFTQAKTS